MSQLQQILGQQFSVASDDLAKAQHFQQRNGGTLEHILVNMGALAEESLPALYRLYLDLPSFDDFELDESAQAMQGQGFDELMGYGWLVVSNADGRLDVLAQNPLHPEALELFESLCASRRYRLFAVSESQFDAAAQPLLELATEVDKDQLDQLSSLEEDKLRELASEAPVVNLLNSLIAKGLKLGASDMHLEPSESTYRVRMRIDGVLKEVDTVPARLSVPILSRLKILSGMDIAEKRRPQDGKIDIKVANEKLDIRVSALPLAEGESMVLRFLRQQSIRYDIASLGLSDDILQAILADIRKTSGVVLLTGPTGSGKTTSLYTFLSLLNDESRKIITLEDPVEYRLNGVNQVQVQSDIGFGFAEGLRSIVRQDPDVIMLGEIRDAETARIAMQSALTGHLVFSTVHTNDAPSAFTRLLDLGAEEYLLNAALVSIVAQRLVRKLCTHCSEPVADIEQLTRRYPQLLDSQFRQGHPLVLRQPVGCEHCGHTGYKGRMAVIEYLAIDDQVRALKKDQHFLQRAIAYHREQGGRGLMDDGLLKVAQGLTTAEEVMRVAN
ncbi:GspE/PulE family protein [Aliagarivorans taiwanensis]|uniref:GspE/PulE family protein n=1 Tax=Aliagarivorans taiwanensis TaxID=561966 RepID=UPI000418B736|nr:GspE/PulE family protein [Aliagarivorans taiwanensis]